MLIRALGVNKVQKKSILLAPVAVFLLIILSLSLLSTDYFCNISMAQSPSFELQELINENRNWVQTYGNNDTHLKSNYTDILAVNYISDGQTLNTTMWLSSGFNLTAFNSTDNQLSRKLVYGMLIDSDTNTKTGYNGADYDLYVESVGGKLSGYLYQLSSTGGYRLIGSKTNFTPSHEDPPVGPGHANLDLDLSSISSPREYNLLFYAAESHKSNEVRQFTNYVTIPPPSLQITTVPESVVIRQGEEQLIPARIQSTSGFSNDVINLTNANYSMAPGFNSSELNVDIQRNQPPLIKIAVPQQTPLGIYTVPLEATIREPSMATTTKPTYSAPRGGTVVPEFLISEKYPTVGFLTKPINLTVTVIPPESIDDKFKGFWDTYGQFIGIFAGAFVGAFAKQMFDKVKGRKEKERE